MGPLLSSEENFCRELFGTLNGGIWKWDDRFECLLSEFRANGQDKVRAVMQRHLTSTWEVANIGGAPDVVQFINSHFGGLRAGQILFTSDPSQNDLIYCSWWPWGDGKTISIRFSPFYTVLPDSKKIERIKLFKSWFGLSNI